MQQLTVTIKLVIFGVISDALAVFLHEGNLPTTPVMKDVPLDTQVEELFLKSVGLRLENNYSEQLYTVTNDNEIAIVYFVLIPLEHTQKFATGWTRVKEASGDPVISYAIQRLQWKIEYTNVVYSLLPKEFTLSELQKTYEAILGQILDKRNFRKKILSLAFLEPTGKRRVGVSRPAQMYTFKKRTPMMVKIFS